MEKILDACPNETQLVAETENALTELYVGIKNCVGDRDAAEKNGGNKTE